MQDLGIRVLFMGDNFARLLSGLWVTVRISLISVVLSIILGVLLGMVMTIKNPVTKALTKIYLEFVRIMPQLVLLFLVYFGLTKSFGINLSGEASSIIVFTIWGTAEMDNLRFSSKDLSHWRVFLRNAPEKHSYRTSGD